MKKIIALAALSLFACPVFAQEGESVATLMARHWKISKEFTIAVAEVMPESGYSFKPNDEEMSFGDLMIHIAMANANYASRAAGEKNPFTKPESSDKAAAMKILNESYDYCIQKLGGLSGELYSKMSGPTGRQMSGTEAAWAGFTHAAHHRGQAEVYLRVKGLKPPAYRF